MSKLRLEQQHQPYYVQQTFSISPQRRHVYYYMNVSPAHTVACFFPQPKSKPISYNYLNLKSKGNLQTECSKQKRKISEVQYEGKCLSSLKSVKQQKIKQPKLQYINESVEQIIQQSFKKKRETNKKKDDIMKQIYLLEQQLNKLKLD